METKQLKESGETSAKQQPGNAEDEKVEVVIEKGKAETGADAHAVEKRNSAKRRQLGKLLVEQGLISSDELNRALELQEDQGGRLGEILVSQGLIDDEVLLDILSIQLNVPVIDIKGTRINHDAISLIPEAIAREHFVIPIEIVEGRLLVAMAYPDDIGIINDIKAITKMRLEVALCSPKSIEQAIDLNYKSREELEKQVGQFTKAEEKIGDRVSDNLTNTPAAQSLTMIIKQAIQDRASDIHFEPQENELRVRFRIDGILHDIFSLPTAAHLPLLSRLKILSGMNIAEQRRPQDGQFSITIGGRSVDVRVASMGSLFGERATLRILDKSLPLLTLDQLGFLPEPMGRVENMLRSNHGMILVGGPTGSGKTTTLYAMINHLNSDEKNIMTIEDPIEYHFAKISQFQINPRADITFSSGLRALVRQDPDVILIGEIRDQETGRIAVQAALTGHLVLASIHANDAVNILFRLIDLGIDPYLISSTVVGLIAQRMVRRLCSYCRVPEEPSTDKQSAYKDYMSEETPVLYTGNGCTVCANTGYFGRTGTFETLLMNDEIKSMLSKGMNVAEIKQKALQQGMITMGQDGMIKAKQGITSTTEVLRCIDCDV